MIRKVVMLMLGAGCAVLCPANEWSQFRGPHGNGTSADGAINRDWKARPPALLWSFPLGDEGWSNPAVDQGHVFVMDHEGGNGGRDVARSLDLKTGRVLWSAPIDGPSVNTYGFTGPTPAVDGGKLYCVSRQLQLSCLDAATGKELWKRDLARDFSARKVDSQLGWTASPLVDGQQVIVVPGGADASVVALDKTTGETRWKAPGGNPGFASPIIYGEGAARQVVVFNGEGLIGFNPGDGQRLWTQPWHTPLNQNSATPIVVGKRIFITSAWKVGSGLVDITDNKPAVIWTTKEFQARFSSPVQVNGFIYGISEPQPPGLLVCLDAATGETKWKQPGFEFGSIVAVGGTLIVVNGKTGDIIAVEATGAGYKELGRVKQDPPTSAWNTPIVVDGKLLVRNKKALLCMDVAP